MVGIGNVGGELPVRLSAWRANLQLRPLTMAKDVVNTLKSLLDAGAKGVITVDFALGRFKSQLRDAGLNDAAIKSLMTLNLDHHDGVNRGLTATEVVLRAIDAHPGWFDGRFAVVADQQIDHDDVMSTFAAQNPDLAKQHQGVISQVARYGDYCDTNVSETALKIALVVDEMRFGENSFHAPFFKLTPDQQAQLFDEMVAAVPRMLENIESFRGLYESEFGKLQAAKTRAITEHLVADVPNSRFCAVINSSEGISRPIQNQVSDRGVIINQSLVGTVTDKDGATVEVHIYNPVGLNPRVLDCDLTELFMVTLRQAENAKRANLGLKTLEDSANWGGRGPAGGSNRDKNVGSVLTVAEVAAVIDQFVAEKGVVIVPPSVA